MSPTAWYAAPMLRNTAADCGYACNDAVYGRMAARGSPKSCARRPAMSCNACKLPAPRCPAARASQCSFNRAASHANTTRGAAGSATTAAAAWSRRSKASAGGSCGWRKPIDFATSANAAGTDSSRREARPPQSRYHFTPSSINAYRARSDAAAATLVASAPCCSMTMRVGR